MGSRLFILTGAPGSGKTAVLNQLKGEFRCVGEPARQVLAEQRASGGRGTWDQDPSLFVALLLRRSIENYEAAAGRDETVVFDRGIPDCVVYATRAGSDPSPSWTAIDACRYHLEVLFFEPWRDIYTTDEERIMSFEDVVLFSEELTEVYSRAGYVLVTVPQTSLEDRAAFLRDFIRDRNDSTG